MKESSLPLPCRSLLLALCGLAVSGSVSAEAIAVPPKPAIGTNTVAVADPLVARPKTQPCIVDLLTEHEFVGDKPVPMAYAPPAACPGPWAKVVIEADFHVTKGRQFDRTAIINLGGVNLYLGTTMEPRRDIAPAWHAERDITDYAALLTTQRDGEFLLANYLDDTYTGHVFGRARLLFYPLDPGQTPPPTAQLIIPLTDHLTSLDKATPALAKTLTLPRNIERLYLDVLAEPQGDDEFWYGCVSDRFVTDGSSLCGGGSLRETEVAIDGVSAGVAPIYPWIYTGGINPYLWFPSPGVETLNFSPYRVDLTPFAASLNDGLPHTVSLQVYGVRRYVFAMGTLMAWLDDGKDVVTGALTRNTLAAPVVRVDDTGLTAKGSDLNGAMTTSLERRYDISGYIDTSHGRVTTNLQGLSTFGNRQTFVTSAAEATWHLQQVTMATTVVTTTDAAGVHVHATAETFPLEVYQHDRFETDYGLEDIDLDQGLQRIVRDTAPDGQVTMRTLDLSQAPKLHALLDPKTHRTKTSTSSAVTHVKIKDDDGTCYDRTITNRNNTVIAVTDACPANP